MIKTSGAALALILAGAPIAWAQNIEIGPGGVRVGPDRDRRVIERREVERERRTERCRTTIVERQNRRGETVRERIRECD
jgi:hypothetical protein